MLQEGTKWPATRRSTHVWVSSRDPDVRKTVGLEVELKLNLPSSCEDTNQVAGLAIGGAGGGLPVQRAGTRSRIVGEGNCWHFFVLFFLHAARNAKPPGLPKEEQNVSERLPFVVI